jgi:hypothetical protein
MPGGKCQNQPPMWSRSWEMQMKKNQSVQGCLLPPPVGSGFVTVVVMGMMAPGGQVAQMGRGVVVELVVGLVVGGEADQSVTRLQSTDTTPVVAAKKVTTLVVGQLKPTAHVVRAVQSVEMVTEGVAKTMVL